MLPEEKGCKKLPWQKKHIKQNISEITQRQKLMIVWGAAVRQL